MNLEADGEHSTFPFRMYTADAKRWKNSLMQFARENRKKPTPAEDCLWQALRGSQVGARFRRQHAIHHFIVDFVCLAAWLIVEVDGDIHTDAEQAEYDDGRTITLQEHGFMVLRFTNEQVLNNTLEVIGRINEHLKSSFQSQ